MSAWTQFGRRVGVAAAGVALLVACASGGGTKVGLTVPSTTASPATTSSVSTTSPSTTVAPPPTTADAGETGSPLTARSRFHVRGVGPVHAGMTVREAEAATRVSLRISGLEAFDGLCYYAVPEDVDGLSFMVTSPGRDGPTDPRDGVIARAEAGAAPWQTLSGVGPGSTEAEVTAAYGDRVKAEAHAYEPGGSYLTLTGTGADARFGIRFEISRDHVVKNLFSGDADAITAIEGCA